MMTLDRQRANGIAAGGDDHTAAMAAGSRDGVAGAGGDDDRAMEPAGRGHDAPLGMNRRAERLLDRRLPEERGQRLADGATQVLPVGLGNAHGLDEAARRGREDRRQQPHRDHAGREESREAQAADQTGG